MNLDPGHKEWLLGVIWPEGVDTPDGLRYLAMARGDGSHSGRGRCSQRTLSR